MFDAASGIEVRIVQIIPGATTPELYNEWRASKRTLLYKQNPALCGPNVAYITPCAGHQFAVETIIHPIASFMSQREFYIQCIIDGHKETETTRTIEIPSGGRKRKTLTRVIDSCDLSSGGERQSYSFRFSEAVLSNMVPKYKAFMSLTLCRR